MFRAGLGTGDNAAYDDFHMKRFVAPILPWVMLGAALSIIVLWLGTTLRSDEPSLKPAMIYIAGGVVLALLAWLCYRQASRGAVNATGIIVVAFGGTMSSIICWGAHEKFGPCCERFRCAGSSSSSARSLLPGSGTCSSVSLPPWGRQPLS